MEMTSKNKRADFLYGISGGFSRGRAYRQCIESIRNVDMKHEEIHTSMFMLC